MPRKQRISDWDVRTIENWAGLQCRFDNRAETPTLTLYQDFDRWARGAGEYCGSVKWFVAALLEAFDDMNVARVRLGSTARGFRGIRLKTPEERAG